MTLPTQSSTGRGWVVIAAAVPLLAIAGVLGVAAVIGLRFAAECRIDWPALGASLLMSAWSVRWLISGVAVLRGDGRRFERTIQRVQAAGFAVAAVALATEFFSRQAAWPFSWWPLAVSVLLAVVAAVYVRDSKIGREAREGVVPR